MNRCTKIFLVVATIWGLQASTLSAQQSMLLVYELEPVSRLWLEGTATVGDFVCETQRIEGVGRIGLNPLKPLDPVASDSMRNKVCVLISVKSFECGNSVMNTDIYNAMKADSFPFIQYELVEAYNVFSIGSMFP